MIDLHEVISYGTIHDTPASCYDPGMMVTCDRCKETYIGCFVHYKDTDVCRRCAETLLIQMKEVTFDYLSLHKLGMFETALKASKGSAYETVKKQAEGEEDAKYGPRTRMATYSMRREPPMLTLMQQDYLDMNII